ncbi:hypothetical protein predicted by Glimmer/Critica [Acetobacter senegalensis]|uniref:Uncharacterized protein n=1 Tax=Acetobacter senegalensis TaxID=446692 RepID=A0A0U5FK04_9PROT|nr:hypothetical protein predicted by Glimmer/Critica [Acetobacter senegalensis]
MLFQSLLPIGFCLLHAGLFETSARSAGPRFWGLSVLDEYPNNVSSSLQIFCF